MGDLRAREILADGGRRVVALEVLDVDQYRAGELRLLRARLELRAVIVLENGAWRALGADGRERPMAALRRQYPALDSLLRGPRRDRD